MFPTLIRSALALAAIAVLTYLFGPIFLVTVTVLALLYGIARMAAKPRAPWMHAGLPVLLLALAIPVLAMAADAAPETIAQSVSESTKVTWAWGATVSQAGQAIAWILASIAMVLLRQLPANIVAIFGNARVELLLNNAIGYGLNAVQGAVKDKTLSVDVGNEVLAKALQYAVDNAPAWLQSWAGGPEGLAKKIWARLNLGEGASDAALPAAVSTVSAP